MDLGRLGDFEKHLQKHLQKLDMKRFKLKKKARVIGWNQWKKSDQLPELFPALLPITTLVNYG